MKQIKVFAVAFIAVLCFPHYVQAQFNQTPSGEYFRQEGNASWYGNEFEGRRTASGEIFNSSLLTAAHPTLPFGTFLIVTNRNNNRQVTVKVNDRGPFVASRILDVSRAAAEQLDMIYTGVAPVFIETMHPASQQQSYLPQNGYMQPQSYPQAAMPQSYLPPQATVPQSYPMQPQANVPQGFMPPMTNTPQSYPMQPQANVPQGFMPPQVTVPQGGYMDPQAAMPPQGYMPQSGLMQNQQPQSAMPPQSFAQQPQILQQPHIMYITPPTTPVPPLPPMANSPAPGPVSTEQMQFPIDPVSVIVYAPPPVTLPTPSAPANVTPSPAQEPLSPMIAPIAASPAASPLPPLQNTIPDYAAARLTPPTEPQADKIYKLQVGTYQQAQNAVAAFTRLKAAGLAPSYERAGDMYRVVLSGVRGYDVRTAAEKLGGAGFGEAIIREE